ncbi:hypothetical protein ZIOFF_028327 [Zingiber officinale]|uniref:DDE Tnp4 domain-containing protein n=1 Tax=Zingiber officinale TaxID=94328 RepID=A0A8J5GL52_ZINOF|nr:hypothetical protein ZIOFF_028327 [Zingiber officinale]
MCLLRSRDCNAHTARRSPHEITAPPKIRRGLERSQCPGCLGALDGTYINVKVPGDDEPRYRTRKGEIATNVLVCTQNMQFSYVLPGWEGSADGRVLRDAISRRNGLKIPQVIRKIVPQELVQNPTDAVEEINLCDEETDIFECEIDEHAEFHKDEEYVREETKKSEMETQDSVCDLVGEISKYVTVITEANEEMKGISTYFMKQTENSDKKMRIYDELMELSDFSQQEIMDVGEYILKDDHKVDNFNALPKAFRREYVMKQLSKINPYATN